MGGEEQKLIVVALFFHITHFLPTFRLLMASLSTIVAFDRAPIVAFIVGVVLVSWIASFELPQGTMLDPMSVLLALVTFTVEVRNVGMNT